MEGVFSFFLESTFLGLFLYGEKSSAASAIFCHRSLCVLPLYSLGAKFVCNFHFRRNNCLEFFHLPFLQIANTPIRIFERPLP